MKRRAIHLPIRGGYTLVELILAMVGAGALLAGLSSTMIIAIRATNTSNTPTAATIDGNSALIDLLADLEFALSSARVPPLRSRSLCPTATATPARRQSATAGPARREIR